MSKENIRDVLQEAGFDVEEMINQHKDPRVGVYTLVQSLCLQKYPSFIVTNKIKHLSLPFFSGVFGCNG